MKHTKRALLTIPMTLALVLGTVVVAPVEGPVALQSADAKTWIFGGKITNHKSSNCNIRVSGNLVFNKKSGSYRMLSPIETVKPGKSTKNARSKTIRGDADAYVTPSNCKTYVYTGTRWVKIKSGVLTKVPDWKSVLLKVKY